MRVFTQTRKLAELRAKTDQQLLEIIDIHLNRGMAYVCQMAEADSRGYFPVAEKFRNLASQECNEAEGLRELLGTSGKSGRIDTRFRQLREYLVSGAPAVRSACV